MDIFGKKKIAELQFNLTSAYVRVDNFRAQIADLKKPIENHKNRFRTFIVTLYGEKSITIKARRFSVDVNGYSFFEVDKSGYFDGNGLVSFDGHMIGHIPTKYVQRVMEVTE